MFLEYLKGACKENWWKWHTPRLNSEAHWREQCCEKIEHVARPFPDNQSDGHHYLPLSKTPADNRLVDDYMPRVQLKAAYASGQCSLDDDPPVSWNSQENLLWLRDASKTIWSIWHYSILRKTKERRKDWLKSQLRQARYTKSMIGTRCLKMAPLVSRQ